MTLHTKILDAARDEVAIKHADDWEQKVSGYTHWVERYSPGENRLLAVEKKAALLAMEKQAGFLLWTFWMDWIYSDGRFMNSKSGDVVSDLELYAIWKEGK